MTAIATNYDSNELTTIIVNRRDLADSDIVTLEKFINLYLGISGKAFTRAFKNKATLSFKTKKRKKGAEKCVKTLNSIGISATIHSERSTNTTILTKESQLRSVTKEKVSALSYDECCILLGGNKSGLTSLKSHRNTINMSFFLLTLFGLLIVSYNSIIL